MKTTVTKASDIKRSWHLIDAKNQTLGRLSTQIAELLIGKAKPYFTPSLDCGDYVVVVNAKDIKVTGKKTTDKLYRHHTGFPGGFREINFEDLMEKDPRKVITLSLKGMLPKNKLRADRLKRLKVFPDASHPYENLINAKAKKEE